MGGGGEDEEATLVQKITGVVKRTVIETLTEYAGTTITTTIVPEGCRETLTASAKVALETPSPNPVPAFVTTARKERVLN